MHLCVFLETGGSIEDPRMSMVCPMIWWTQTLQEPRCMQQRNRYCATFSSQLTSFRSGSSSICPSIAVMLGEENEPPLKKQKKESTSQNLCQQNAKIEHRNGDYHYDCYSSMALKKHGACGLKFFGSCISSQMPYCHSCFFLVQHSQFSPKPFPEPFWFVKVPKLTVE